MILYDTAEVELLSARRDTRLVVDHTVDSVRPLVPLLTLVAHRNNAHLDRRVFRREWGHFRLTTLQLFRQPDWTDFAIALHSLHHRRSNQRPTQRLDLSSYGEGQPRYL